MRPGLATLICLISLPNGLVGQQKEGNPTSEEAGSRAAVDVIRQVEDIPGAMREPMLAAIQRRPESDRWTGKVGTRFFALAARRLPRDLERSRALPISLTAAQMIAVHEILASRALLDAYAGSGLSDVDALREALLATYREFRVIGEANPVLLIARPHDVYAVALVIAEEQNLKAWLLQPAELVKVRMAYREVKHSQARTLMRQEHWTAALDIWQHLHERQLVSADLYVDAASCFQKLSRPRDAHRLLEEAWQAYAASAFAGWLERYGDCALALGASGEALAQRAYERASERLLQRPAAIPTKP